jgi:phosphoribosyl 1,2-cyclic phosphodiesterase
MELRFLGTRGEIDIRSRTHRLHSSLLLTAANSRLMIDCGLDWSSAKWRLAPQAILLTHAHPDHAGGLRDGSPCPVFGTADALVGVNKKAVADCRVIEPRVPLALAGARFEAFPVEHSLRAPAVGFRITTPDAAAFYVPDVVAIPDGHEALKGVDLYIGDGASIVRPIVRIRNGSRIGHASIREQLEWCAAEGVQRAIFTHCGSAIVRGDSRSIAAQVRALGHAVSVDAAVARDGLRLELSRQRQII